VHLFGFYYKNMNYCVTRLFCTDNISRIHELPRELDVAKVRVCIVSFCSLVYFRNQVWQTRRIVGLIRAPSRLMRAWSLVTAAKVLNGAISVSIVDYHQSSMVW